MTDEFMTASSWFAYDQVARGGQFSFRKPLPGWRIDYILEDGSIADYNGLGFRYAKCLAVAYAHNGKSAEALDHGEDCSCGYRVLRDPWRLIGFFCDIEAYFYAMDYEPGDWLIFGASPGCKAITPALTRVYAMGTCERSLDPSDPEGTIRTSQTKLVDVWVPAHYRMVRLPDGLADKVANRYRVDVHVIDGNIAHFPGIEGDTPMPPDWTEYRDKMSWLLDATKHEIQRDRLDMPVPETDPDENVRYLL